MIVSSSLPISPFRSSAPVWRPCLISSSLAHSSPLLVCRCDSTRCSCHTQLGSYRLPGSAFCTYWKRVGEESLAFPAGLVLLLRARAAPLRSGRTPAAGVARYKNALVSGSQPRLSSLLAGVRAWCPCPNKLQVRACFPLEKHDIF